MLRRSSFSFLFFISLLIGCKPSKQETYYQGEFECRVPKAFHKNEALPGQASSRNDLNPNRKPGQGNTSSDQDKNKKSSTDILQSCRISFKILSDKEVCIVLMGEKKQIDDDIKWDEESSRFIGVNQESERNFAVALYRIDQDKSDKRLKFSGKATTEDDLYSVRSSFLRGTKVTLNEGVGARIQGNVKNIIDSRVIGISCGDDGKDCEFETILRPNLDSADQAEIDQGCEKLLKIE